MRRRNHKDKRIWAASGSYLLILGTISILGIFNAFPKYAPFKFGTGIKGRVKFTIKCGGNDRMRGNRNVRNLRTNAEWDWGTEDQPHPRHSLIPESTVTTLCGRPSKGTGDGLGTKAKFREPNGIAMGPSGNLYVADKLNNQIRKVSTDGNVTTIAGSYFKPHLEFVRDGFGTEAMFFWPQGIAVDSKENIYVADTYSHTIRKIDPNTQEVTTIAGKAGLWGYGDGPKQYARFNFPYNLFVTEFDEIYVTDTQNFFIRKIDPDGEVSTLEGLEYFPELTEEENKIVKPLTLAIGDGITFNKMGHMFLVDSKRSTVNEVKLDGTMNIFVGDDDWSGVEDGVGTEATFHAPTDIVMDKEENMYLCDQYNNLIRKILPDKTVLTMAGDTRTLGGANEGHEDGASNEAKFFYPSGIAIDTSGKILYVVDSRNNCIRKIEVS